MNRGVIQLLRVALGLLMLGCSPVLYAWDAKVPLLKDVPAAQSTAIDGIWRLQINSARIRIEAGRAYALDPWVYLLLWKVKPQMVVMRNFREVSIGSFTADELLLAGPATLQLINPDELRVQVKGALGPATYKLLLVEADDPQALQTAWGQSPTDPAKSPSDVPSDLPPPSSVRPSAQPPQEEDFVTELPTAECEKSSTDPDSGMTVCL